MFFRNLRKRKHPAGLHHTEGRIGCMAWGCIKTTFSINSIENNKSGNQPKINHRNDSLFVSLHDWTLAIAGRERH